MPKTSKAIALKILGTAILTWNEGILEASQRNAYVLGVSAMTIRIWAINFYISIIDITPEDMDDESVENILLNN